MSGAAVEPARRIVIIGRMGSGKSTLGTRLAEELALPIIHLSEHLKDAGERTGDAEQRRRIQGLTAGREWIIEGSYFRVVDLLFAAATVVVILDVPMHRALARFLRRERSRVNHGWSRRTLRAAIGLWKPLFWIWYYPLVEQRRIFRAVRADGVDALVIVATSGAEAERELLRLTAW